MDEDERETLSKALPPKKPTLKKILYRKMFVAFFLSILFSDQYWAVKYHAYTYELEIERRAYIAISYFLFFLALSSYLKLVFETSHQTKIEALKYNEPNRIFNFDETAFSKKCAFCSGAAKHLRSSHCSTCQICVLKRDHHCTWVDNCIGHRNLNVFWTYMFWLLLYGVIYLLGFSNFYNNKLSILDRVGIGWRMLILLTSIVTAISFLGDCYMMGEKFFEYLNGATYYEELKDSELEKYFTCCVTKMHNSKHYNVYNKGWLANMESLYGPTLLHFFLPLPRMRKTDLVEQENSFLPNTQLSLFARIKALSGTAYGSLESILANQDAQSSPEAFMNYARSYYPQNKVRII